MDRERLTLADEIKKVGEIAGGDYGPKSFCSTGCTILNLAASQRGASGGFAMGRVANIVGDGSSGKTLLALSVCAEAKKKDPSMVIRYDNAEEAMDFDVSSLFKLDPEGVFLEEPSTTVEEFGHNFVAAVKDADGSPLVYVLDSMDSLGSSEERAAMLKALQDGKPLDGSYNLARQKFMNSFFREYIVNNMSDNVLLIIVSQVRDKIGVVFGKKQYRTGGKALDFYTHQVVWLHVRGELKRVVKKHERTYGVKISAKFERNKVAKPFREADFEILYDYGIDDVGSMVDWLKPGEKAQGNQKVYSWHTLTNVTRNVLISHIEAGHLEGKLQDEVEREWHGIEEGFIPDRKEKY